MNNIIKQYFYMIMSLLLFSNTLVAAKVASSESYLKNLEISLDEFEKSFNDFKTILSEQSNTNSFVSKDFWGLEHALYIDYAGNLSTTYPFTDRWMNRYGNYNNYASNYVRNINGVIFFPVGKSVSDKPSMWREHLNIEFDFHPGYTSSDYYYEHVSKYFFSHGIPQSKIKEAFKVFEDLVEPATILVVEKAYKKMDSIYDGVAKFGDVRILEKIAGKMQSKLDLDSFYTPQMHKDIYPLLMQNSGGIEETIKSKKDLYGEYYNETQKYDLWRFYQQVSFAFSIAVPVQYFEVAKGMSKSEKYNSLMKLKDMLDKKVASGNVKTSVNRKYTVYEDVSNKNAHGRIGIDFKSGIGYWQVPFWDKQKDVVYSIEKINKNTTNVNTVIKNYLNICLEETLKKFKNNKPQTNDF